MAASGNLGRLSLAKTGDAGKTGGFGAAGDILPMQGLTGSGKSGLGAGPGNSKSVGLSVLRQPAGRFEPSHHNC